MLDHAPSVAQFLFALTFGAAFPGQIPLFKTHIRDSVTETFSQFGTSVVEGILKFCEVEQADIALGGLRRCFTLLHCFIIC